MTLGMGSIVIARSQINAIVAHARVGAPDEVCGVVAVRDGTVISVVPTRNAASTPRNRFEIDSRDLMRIVDIERDGLDVGFYHSHPDHPARPSQFDLDHAWPFFSYIIVSVRGGVPEDMTSWRLREDRSAFDQEDLTHA